MKPATAAPPGTLPTCPEKWEFFPQILGGTCLPTYITYEVPDDSSAPPSDGLCPEGWIWVQEAGRCIANTLIDIPRPQNGPPNPGFGCPDMWEWDPDILGGTCVPTWITSQPNDPPYDSQGNVREDICKKGFIWNEDLEKCISTNVFAYAQRE